MQKPPAGFEKSRPAGRQKQHPAGYFSKFFSLFGWLRLDRTVYHQPPLGDAGYIKRVYRRQQKTSGFFPDFCWFSFRRANRPGGGISASAERGEKPSNPGFIPKPPKTLTRPPLRPRFPPRPPLPTGQPVLPAPWRRIRLISGPGSGRFRASGSWSHLSRPESSGRRSRFP